MSPVTISDFDQTLSIDSFRYLDSILKRFGEYMSLRYEYPKTDKHDQNFIERGRKLKKILLLSLNKPICSQRQYIKGFNDLIN